MNFLKINSAVLFLAVAIAVPASAVCNNATLVGVWGFQVGTALGQFTADGAGNLAGAQTVNQNGVILTQTFTGTYSVSTKCTGSVTFNITGGGTGTANFVLDAAKKGVQIIDTISGGVAEGIGFVRGVVTCGLTGKKVIYAAELLGKINGTSPIGYVAQVTLDGKGAVSGTGTFDVGGTYVIAPFTGTYTEKSDCTGTLQFTPSGFSTLNFSMVVVNAGKEILLVDTDANAAVAGNMQK